MGIMKQAIKETKELIVSNCLTFFDEVSFMTCYLKGMLDCFNDWKFWISCPEIHKYTKRDRTTFCVDRKFYYDFWGSINHGAYEMWADYWGCYN
jgi:hypothetical protein